MEIDKIFSVHIKKNIVFYIDKHTLLYKYKKS